MLWRVRKALFTLLGMGYRWFTDTPIARIPGVKRTFHFLELRLWSSPTVLEIQGSKMHVNPNDLPARYDKVFRAHVFQGVWEETTTRLFQKFIQEGDIVADLGANMGYFTLLASRAVGPSGTVFAFEPEDVNFELLLHNIDLNGYRNIVAVRKAVSDKSATARFFIDETDSGRHFIGKGNGGTEKERFHEVETVSLDDFFAGKPPPTLVKMDIEGAELLALEGMSGIIEGSSRLRILTEFYPDLIRRAGDSVEGFADLLLNKWRFRVTFLDDYARHKTSCGVETVEELVSLGTKHEISNLLLEKRATD